MNSVIARLKKFPSQPQLLALSLIASAATVILFMLLQQYEATLQPSGIVGFELAFTPERAALILTTWGQAGLDAARQSLQLDFLFMPAYAFCFFGFTLLSARATQSQIGYLLAIAPFGAWIMDAIENFALLNLVNSPISATTLSPLVAGVAASIKFLLLVAALVYSVIAILRTALRPKPSG